MSIELHIAPQGDDHHLGNREHPLATLEAARDRLRSARLTGTFPPDGATVTLHAGRYCLDATFRLSTVDSGTADGPICYRAAHGEVVELTGGTPLDPATLHPVTDRAILARLPQVSHPHIRVVDLASFGCHIPPQPGAAEVAFRGVPLQLARWPNAGYARIAGVPEVTNADGTPRAAELADGFLYFGDRPRQWRAPEEAWVHVWGNGWASARVQVDRLDPERRHITTRPPYGCYAFPRGGRVFFFNILEELDEPGDYFLDRQAGLLYVWLPEDAQQGDLVYTQLSTPLIELTDVEHVRLEGLTLTHSRTHGVMIRDGADVQIIGCTLALCGRHGVEVCGGYRHRVRGCEVRFIGAAGLTLSGGDRRTLERADHVAENNYVHHYAQWDYCYQPGIGVEGGSYAKLQGSVGIRIAHNRIHDCPHNGILYWGNDLDISCNDIYRVVMEATDAGAIYTGRDFARRGTVIRQNYLHHNGTGGPFGTMGIYLDDCAGGERVIGNVLQEHRQAVYIGGGTDTVCENNLFIDCHPALHLDMRGLLEGSADILRERFYEVSAHMPPYSTHYPELAKIHAHYEKDEGIPPEGTRVCCNIATGDGAFWSYASCGVDRRCLIEERNLCGLPSEQVDLPRGGLAPALAAQERTIGFERITMASIGLVRDASRDTVPPRSLLDYRLVVERPWSWRDNAVTDPTLRLEVVNLGETHERGVAALFVSPAEEATIAGAPCLAFNLAPGEVVRSAPFSLVPDTHVTHLELGIRRLGTVDVPVWHWLYLQHTLVVTNLGALGTVEQAAAALSTTEPIRTPAWDGTLGDVRVGVTDQALAITFALRESDLRPCHDDRWWQEACIELFSYGPAHPVTEQIGLVPAGDGVPAQALWFHNGIRQSCAPGVQIVSEPCPHGYRLAALIPDHLLGWDRTRANPTLEISINSKPHADAPRERLRVFGVAIWQNERHRYAQLVGQDATCPRR